MDAGWTALPSVIIENQRQLMLSPLDLNIIVYLASKWWTAEGKPFPSKTTMAKAMDVHPRTIQKHIAALEGAGYIRREERSEEHTSELQSLMRISYAVFCLKKKNKEKQ